MKRNFTLGLAVFVLMALMTAVVNAQDADNPWHLVAFENDEEVAFYNTEMITGIEATVQNVTISLDNGKEFSHPTETATFGFEPRKDGTGTANEAITTPGWSVSYTNNRLHFSKPVTGISVYNLYGALVTHATGIFTEVPVNLVHGLYIVQAEGKSAKVFVGNSSNGNVTAQPVVEKLTVANNSNPVNLRAGILKTYWNITAGGTVTPVEMAQVEKFYFTLENSIVFILKNGNIIELADFQGVEFSVELVPTTNSGWDLERTFTIGGGGYGYNVDLSLPMSHKIECISVVSKTEVIIFDVDAQKENRHSRSGIPSDLLSRTDARISILRGAYTFSAISYPIENGERIFFQDIANPDMWVRTQGRYYDFNGGTNKIPTTFEIDKDGNLITTYTNADKVTRQYKFNK